MRRSTAGGARWVVTGANCSARHWIWPTSCEKEVEQRSGSHVLHNELLHEQASHDLDRLHVLIDVHGLGITGYQAADWVRAHRAVDLGLPDHRLVEVTLSTADDHNTVRRLLTALDGLVAAAVGDGPTELDVVRVQRWCAARVPEHVRHQVRVECQVAARHLTIVERRVHSGRTSGRNGPASRSRYTAADKSWTLYWRDDRNLPFHTYDPLAPSNRVDDLLTEIDRDPTCIIWG